MHKVLVGKPEGKRPLARPRRRWDDNIKIIFRKWDGDTDWIDLDQERDGWSDGCCKRGIEPSGPIKFGEFLDYLRTG